MSEEATRDLPKFVTFLEKKVKVFCAHCLLYIIIIFLFLKRPVGESTRKDMFFFYSEIKADKET